MNETPIAYQSGRAGPLIHVGCWDSHDADTQARTGNKAYLGTLVFHGHPTAKHHKCGFCGKHIEPYEELKSRLLDLVKRLRVGCGNHGCCVAKPKGAAMNGPCQCGPNALSRELIDIANELRLKSTREKII